MAKRKKSKYHQFKQGIFTPQNRSKCLNVEQKKEIRYLSSLELKFMRWCDKNESVTKWGSEIVILNFKKPPTGKTCRYYPDFLIEMHGQVYLIEIKPEKQTKRPVPSNRKKASTVLKENLDWAVNSEKWKCAKEYCKHKGWNFRIVTEVDIKSLIG